MFETFQEKFIQSLFFWGFFWILTSWVLGNFYLQYREKATRNLRRIGVGVNAFVFLLMFTVWLSPEKGSFSGFDFLRAGRIDMALYAIALLVATLTVILTRHTTVLKIGAGFQIAASILIFAVMIRVNNAFTVSSLLDPQLIPVYCALLLIVNNVIILLYVHQLQLKEKEER